MSLESGTRLGSYEILAFIGAGGAGELYRARDTRLGREIAIKVLRRDLEADPDRRRRFEEEARAASALNHPNIITIHQIGDHDDLCYIAMELVDGQTVREIVEAGGPLSVERTRELARQILSGLAKAHGAGVVHGDLTPANLMVNRDGLVKILDFGLARLFTVDIDADSPTVTTHDPVGVAGTMAYMAPEQALGKPVTARSDIFSLGVVLYEMLSGRRPFDGRTPAALFDAILNRSPEPLPSGGLSSVVARCLAKDPADRYASAAAMLADLEQLMAPELPTSQRSVQAVAVIPFRNLSREQDTEYFSDGLTEEVILDLSKVSSLRVISRTSAILLKGTDKDLKTLGRELDVDYVLEGSVRRAKDRVRITAQLVEVASDAHIWGERFSGTVDDLFAFQEEISRKIVESLRLTLSPEEDRRIAERPIDDIRAYECYMRARQEIWRFSEAGLERAQKLIEQGLAIVGENEVLYSTMGLVHWQYFNTGLRPDVAELDRAEHFSGKAMTLGAKAAQTFVLRALVRLKRDNHQAAVPDLKRALEIAPGDPDATFWLCLAYANGGKTAEALPLANRLREIDPLNPLSHAIHGIIAFMDARWEDAVAPMRSFVEADEQSPIAQWSLASSLVRAGGHEEALAIFRRLQDPPSAFAMMSALFERALKGDREGVCEALKPELTRIAELDELYAFELSGALAHVGERDLALRWLETTIRRGMVAYRMFEADPLFASLRDDPGYRALIDEARRRSEAFET